MAVEPGLHGFSSTSSACGPLVSYFNDTAWSQRQVTDKVSDHAYEVLYGVYLVPHLLALAAG